MIKTRTTLGLGLALLLTASLSATAFAVGHDDDPELAFCQSVGELSTAVGSLATLDASSTEEEFQTAVDSASEAADAVRDDLQAVLEAQGDEIQCAVDGLRDYRDSIGDDVTIEAAVDGAGPAVAEVARAFASAGNVDCQAVLAESAAQQAEDKASDDD